MHCETILSVYNVLFFPHYQCNTHQASIPKEGGRFLNVSKMISELAKVTPNL